MPLIYKICPAPLWREAERAGRFDGSADDQRDGFIHFSAADQVAGTAAKHFTGQSDLLLVSVDADRLGPALKWEPSRGGALFPPACLFELGQVSAERNAATRNRERETVVERTVPENRVGRRCLNSCRTGA
jgi:uncharacterized protein (DUF952 family)